MPNKPIADLTGRRFGRLVVIELYEKRRTGNGTTLYWKCLCDCGNETVSLGNGLKNGDTKSCGCFRADDLSNRMSKDLLGKRFGMLSVILRDKDYVRPSTKGHTLRWLCKCDCGNKISVVSNSLLSGKTVSCGCLLESLIANRLKKYFSENYNANIEYKIFRNPDTNYYLPYDIYIPCGDNAKINGIYIEINDSQHYKICQFHRLQAKKKGTTPEEEFEYQKKKDRAKRKFARNNGVYVEINLEKIKTTEYAIEYIKNILNTL